MMNKSIRLVAWAALLLTLVLLVNLTRVHAFSEQKYAQNPLNQRIAKEIRSKPLGDITTGGLVLAHSIDDGSGNYHRTYQHNPQVYAPITGYRSEYNGATNLEQSQLNHLNGSSSNLLGQTTQGSNVELTIVPEAQEAAFKALTDNNYVGGVTAIRPSTGEILAMASTPTFDPNQMTNNETAGPSIDRLSKDRDQPLLNHGTQRPLPPGSTFKVVTTAAGLAEGYNANSSVTAASNITLPNTNTQLENYGGSHCGSGGSTTTLKEAFARSCNTAFVEMAVKSGDKAMREAAESFGIGETYNDLGLPQDPSTLGELPDAAALGITAIGQMDVTMTPLSNAIVAATIANGGKRMQPYIVKKVVGADLRTIEETKPKAAKPGLDGDVAQQLTELMLEAEKYAHNSQAGIASKTGTAEHGEDSRNSKPHVWYIAFDPDNDVAVAVVVENGGGQGVDATGGVVAAPIGRTVINAVNNATK